MTGFTVDHGLLAEVLLLLSSNEDEKELPFRLLKQAELSDPKQKPVLLQILARVLEKAENRHAEEYLSNYVFQLLDGKENTGEDQFSVVATVASIRPSIQKDIAATVACLLEHELARALQATVSGDDSFAIPSQGFMALYIPSQRFELQGETKLVNFEKESGSMKGKVLPYLEIMKLLLFQHSDKTAIEEYIIRLTAALLAALGLRDLTIFRIGAVSLPRLFERIDERDVNGRWEAASNMIFHRLKDLILSGEAIVSTQDVYSLWLHWISMKNCGPNSKMFEDDAYWTMLQTGLITGFTAQKKICLQIFSISIRQLKRSIRTNHFIWYETKRTQMQQAWTRYTTLFEMIAFDTSANQLKDALPELRRLLTPPRYIHGTWTIGLFTLALTNSSTAIQSTAYSLLVSLDETQLGFIAEGGRNFVAKTVLPYALAARNFKVITGIRREICVFGQEISGFISRLLSLEGDFTLDLADELLDYAINAYDTINGGARVYLLEGIVQGLEGKQVLKTSHLEKVVQVSQMRRLPRMRSELSAALCLKLLMSADINAISLCDLVSALCKVLDKNEDLLGLSEARKLRSLYPPERLANYQTGEIEMNPENMALKICLDSAYAGTVTSTDIEILKEYDSNSIRDSLQLYTNLLVHHSSITNLLLSNDRLKICIKQLLQRVIDTFSSKGCVETISFTSEVMAFGPLILGNGGNLCKILSVLDSRGYPEIHSLFQLAWRQSQAMGEKKPDTSWLMLKATWFSICKQCGKSIAKTGDIVPLSPRDLLDTLESHPRSLLRGNTYESAKILQSNARILDSIFNLLTLTISEYQVEEVSGFANRILDSITAHMRWIENEVLLSIMGCLHTTLDIFDIGPSIAPLANILLQFWEVAAVGTPGIDMRKIFSELLSLIFHPQFIKASIHYDGISEALNRTARETLKIAITRRGVAPSLSRALRKAFLSCPETFCSNLHFSDILFDIINFVQARDVDFQLEVPLAYLFDKVSCNRRNNYETYFGAPEIFSDSSIYDIINLLSPESTVQFTFGKLLRSKILTHWAKVLENKTSAQFNHEKRTSHLQTLLLLEKFITPEEAGEVIVTTLNMISVEPHPRYRFLFEWMISRIILRYPERAEQVWKLLQPDVKPPNPRSHVSLMKVVLISAAHVQSGREQFYQRLVNTVIPLISNSKVAIRHLAISALLIIWDDAVRFNYASITSNSLLQSFRNFILNSPYYLENEHEINDKLFDPVSNFTLMGIFQGSYLTGGDEVEVITESDWIALLDSDGNRQLPPQPHIPLGNSPPSPSNAVRTIHYTKSESIAFSLSSSTQIPIQTKSGTFDITSVPPSCYINQSFSSSSSRKKMKQNKKQLHILATFISNPLNLGGLSRVSEIFGVSTLYFENPSTVLKTREFTSVSVSSEMWLPIKEVRKENVIAWIRDKKREGFKIIGIEQTDKSVILGGKTSSAEQKSEKEGGLGNRRRNKNKEKGERYKLWGNKTVLVLGSEREGIPAEILGEMDECVEIRQRGETRSLNVQTAAAVVLYEFWREVEEEEAEEDNEEETSEVCCNHHH